MDDVLKNKEQGTFDLDEMLQGRGFPTATETLYTAEDAAQELVTLNERMTTLAQDKRQREYKEEYAGLEAQAQELKNHIEETSLTFHLRGISPGHIKKIQKDVRKEAEKEELPQDEASTLLNAAWIAPHIIKVVRGDGAAQEKMFTRENVLLWQELLPESEWVKLNEKVTELSFKSAYFDAAVDAGFLPKS